MKKLTKEGLYLLQEIRNDLQKTLTVKQNHFELLKLQIQLDITKMEEDDWEEKDHLQKTVEELAIALKILNIETDKAIMFTHFTN